jgi:hypothetical protein
MVPHWMDDELPSGSAPPLHEPPQPSVEHFETDFELEYHEPARHTPAPDGQSVKLPAISRRAGSCLPLGLTVPKIPDFFFSADHPGHARTFALSKYSKNLPKAFALTPSNLPIGGWVGYPPHTYAVTHTRARACTRAHTFMLVCAACVRESACVCARAHACVCAFRSM